MREPNDHLAQATRRVSVHDSAPAAAAAAAAVISLSSFTASAAGGGDDATERHHQKLHVGLKHVPSVRELVLFLFRCLPRRFSRRRRSQIYRLGVKRCVVIRRRPAALTQGLVQSHSFIYSFDLRSA